jgi:hypothetical protein
MTVRPEASVKVAGDPAPKKPASPKSSERPRRITLDPSAGKKPGPDAFTRIVLPFDRFVTSSTKCPVMMVARC